MPATITLEHYEVLTREDGSLHELGRGAMGITYKAFDTQLRVPVALKVVNAAHLDSENARQRFVREARAAAQLRHRNVASVFHLGEEGGNYFYVMEFIDGETVEALVKRQGPLPPEFALRITGQVARALNAAQVHGLVHRDIKPANLMAVVEDDDLVIKVIDFGLAKLVVNEGDPTSANLTQGGFLGTPHFASPEQLEERETDTRSDIYSLGITLWYLLRAGTPFSGSVARVMGQHLTKSPPFEELDAFPMLIVDLLRKMLAKNPAERHQSPAELRTEIEHSLKLLGLSSRIPVERPAPKIAPAAPAPLAARPEEVPLETGVTIGQRYLITEELGESEAGTSFLARDLRQGGEVQLLALHRELLADNESFARIESEAGRLVELEHPNVLEASGLTSIGRNAFLTLSSTNGFSLRQLLRTRRELPFAEACRLLEPVAAGLDHAIAHLPRLELGLHHVLIHFFLEPAAVEALLPRPVSEWPEFIVKVNPLAAWRELFAATWAAGQTRIGLPAHQERKFKSGRDGAVQALGAIAYELLGGVAPGVGAHDYSPLAALDETGNAVLLRVLQSPETFSSAADFVQQLARPPVVDAAAPPVPDPGPPVAEPLPAKAETVDPLTTNPPAEADVYEALFPRRPQRRGFLAPVAGLLLIAAASYAIFHYRDQTKNPMITLATPSPATPSRTTPSPTPAATPLTITKLTTPVPATPIPLTPPPNTPPPPPTRSELASAARRTAETFEARQQSREALVAWLRMAKDFPEFESGRLGLELLIGRLRRRPGGFTATEFTSMQPEIRQAANLGVIAAMMTLGEELRATDPKQAFGWFCAAAQGGEPAAMTQAGLMLTNADGTPRDMHKAVAFFQDASERGDPAAMTALAECYLDGLGVPEDKKQALSLLQKGAAKGNNRARVRLGLCYNKGIGVARNDREAFRLFSAAASDGSVEANANLGVLYMKGEGVEKNVTKAAEKLKEASLKGDVNGMFYYAGCLEDGLGVKADAEAAKKWYQRAAAGGHAEALEWCKSHGVEPAAPAAKPEPRNPKPIRKE